jgi:hypothetical protein
LIGYTRRRVVGLDMRQLLLRFVTDCQCQQQLSVWRIELGGP